MKLLKTLALVAALTVAGPTWAVTNVETEVKLEATPVQQSISNRSYTVIIYLGIGIGIGLLAGAAIHFARRKIG